jgi:hypothetical protein
VNAAASGQRERGADIRVAGEGEFGPRREDPDFGGIRCLLRRQHKRRFGQVELAGDRLHLRRRKPVAIQYDREGISAEPALGKDVDGQELKLHLIGSPGAS